MEMLNIAIIGCGSIYKTHVDAIKEIKNTSIYAVADKKEERAVEAGKELNCKWTTDYRNLLTDENIDIVHITTPHHEHKDLAVEFARNGKHILMEKPLAKSYEDAVELCRQLEETDVKKGIVYQNRYNKTMVHLKEIIEEKKYGELLGLKGILTWDREGSYYTDSDWRGVKEKEGGGVLINQGIHTLDILQWLGGRIVKSAGSTSRYKLTDPIEVEDTGEIFLEYENGARGIFYATNNYSFNSPVEIEAHCERGILNIKNGRLWLYQEEGETLLSRDSMNLSNKSYYGNGHRDLIEGFYNSVRGKSKSYIKLEEGLKALKVIDDIYKRGS